MADISPLNSISDDDELANVLAGVKNEAAAIDKSAGVGSTTAVATLPPVTPAVPPAPNFDFEETAPVTSVTPIADITPIAPLETAAPLPDLAPKDAPILSAPSAPSITTPVASSPELESLKKETLSELRPLVGKLELPAEEKFDTLLLIIRSTDDQSLLAPAHDAAKLITDETRRAAALLDIIKEIDYFSSKA